MDITSQFIHKEVYIMAYSSVIQYNPLISIVTVVFNGQPHITSTLNSILAQNYSYIEYIVIDGKSTDGTVESIDKYKDRLNIYVSECDNGVYDAMNKAIERASGEFIIFMNCGDVFASTDAVSIAMRSAHPGMDQLIFGSWIRRISKENLRHCKPVLERGLFNHQAVIYSRSIHAWHGNYLTVKGLTAADYLFFATLFNSTRVKCTVIDTTLAIIDVTGLSSGLQTISQKFAIDFICNRTSKFQLLLILIFHPIYYRIKSVFRRFC